MEVATHFGKTVLPVHDISYTEYVRRQVLIHLKNGQDMEVSMSQKDFSALLLQYPWFCDCIKGILVNFEDVDKLLEDRKKRDPDPYQPSEIPECAGAIS